MFPCTALVTRVAAFLDGASCAQLLRVLKVSRLKPLAIACKDALAGAGPGSAAVHCCIAIAYLASVVGCDAFLRLFCRASACSLRASQLPGGDLSNAEAAENVLQQLLVQRKRYTEAYLRLAAATLPDAIEPTANKPVGRTQALAVGHRGARGYEKDNTLPSFHRGIDCGAHFIETDVQLLRNGELVLSHEATLRDERLLSSCTMQEALEVEPEMTTLAALFSDDKVYHSGVNVILDVKDHNAPEPLMRFLSDVCSPGMHKRWEPIRIVLNAFDQHVLLQMMAWKEVLPSLNGIALSVMFDGGPLDLCSTFARLGVNWVALAAEQVSQDFMADAHQRGIRVMCWTVNTAVQIQKLLSLGVDAIYSDFPDRVVSEIAQYAQSEQPAVDHPQSRPVDVQAVSFTGKPLPRATGKETAVVMAHRGGKAYAKDNTMPAFHNAVNMKAHMIETDVNILCNRQLVLYHDLTTAAGRFVRDTSPEEALQYMVTLRQFFEDELLKSSGIHVYLDLKQPDYNEELMAELAKICEELPEWHPSRIMIASFNQRQMAHIRELRDQYEVLKPVQLGVIIDGTPIEYAAMPGRIGLDWISVEKGSLTPEFVSDAHARGIKVATWTINQQLHMRRLAMMGVEGLCTDFTLLAHGMRYHAYTTPCVKRYAEQPPNLRLALAHAADFHRLLSESGLTVKDQPALVTSDISAQAAQPQDVQPTPLTPLPAVPAVVA